MEDKVIFQQAFQYHGKNFQRIRAMLPEKPISSLVKYYYLWKRSYSQYSLMDKQARRNGRRLGWVKFVGVVSGGWSIGMFILLTSLELLVIHGNCWKLL